MKAMPGFSFFNLGLDNFYPVDEYGLVEMNEVAKSYFVCWNEGDDGPVMAGKGGHPVFKVIGPKRLTGSSEAWMTLSEVASLLAKGSPVW